MYFGRQESATSPILPYYMESTDYGLTWTSPRHLMIGTAGNPPDTLSMNSTGYSIMVDYYSKIPYILIKLDSCRNSLNSYDLGEIYFIKPNSGNPGNWSFDSCNPVPIITGNPSVFEHISGYPTLGLLYWGDDYYIWDLYGIYGITLSVVDTAGSLEYALTAVYSTDFGNTWDASIINPISSNFSYYFPSCTKHNFIHAIFPDQSHIDVTFIKEYPSFIDQGHYHLYHQRFDFWDLLGIQEQPDPEIPLAYIVQTKSSGNQVQFNLTLPQDGHTTLKIYDVTGREVHCLVDRYLSAGTHYYYWRTANPPGNYKNWGRCMTL